MMDSGQCRRVLQPQVIIFDYLLLNSGNGFTMFIGGKVFLQPEELDYITVAGYIRDGLNGVIGGEYESPCGQVRIEVVNQEDHGSKMRAGVQP